MDDILKSNFGTLMYDVSIVISAAREEISTLSRTLKYCTHACKNLNAKIHLLINGNLQLAKDAAELVSEEFPGHNITVWHFALADKANCWNTYCHSIREKSCLHFFIDGYVRPNSDSIKIALDFYKKHHPVAITGVPSMGTSAKRLRREMIVSGGIHGNLFAMSDDSISKVVESEFRLPIGLYRVDSVIGAAINFQFAPNKFDWDSKQIEVLEDISWGFDTQKWHSLNDIKSQVKRMFRQGRGILENRAVKQLWAIDKRPLRVIPNTAKKLVSQNIKEHPFCMSDFIKHPFMYFAYRNIKNENDKPCEELIHLSNSFEKMTK